MGLGSFIKKAIKTVAPIAANIGLGMLAGPAGGLLQGALSAITGGKSGGGSPLGALGALLNPMQSMLQALTGGMTQQQQQPALNFAGGANGGFGANGSYGNSAGNGNLAQLAMGLLLDRMLQNAGMMAPQFGGNSFGSTQGSLSFQGNIRF